jgi:lysophospholipase L1-like esterase
LRNGVRNFVVRTHAFYDENKTLVSATNTGITSGVLSIPTGQNIKYVRISTYSVSGGGSEWQLEKDSKTDYEPYHLIYALSENIEKTSIEDNEAFVKTSSSLNLVNKDDLFVGKFDDNTAVLDNNTSFISTKPIYIKGYDRIVFQVYTTDVAQPRASLFYDENMNLIAHYSLVYENMQSAEAHPDTCWQSLLRDRTTDGNVYVIPVPENACYYACSTRDTNKDTLMVYGLKGENVEYVYPVPYQPYVEAYRLKQDVLPVERYIKSHFNGKKLVAIGDSITYGTHDAGRLTEWGKRVATMLNMTFVNYGIGGSEIAINKENSPYTPMVSRFSEMDDDADLIIVAGGTNDWGHITGLASVGDGEYLMGEFGDTEPTTFYGALDTMCKGLLAKYVGKTIFFMTPIKRYSGLNTPYYNENYRGYTLEDYVNAIKKVCGHYGIPVLDMFNECSLNPIIEPIKTAYIEDGTHPNSAGHIIMARQIAGFISSLKNDINYN